ncbi:hypothetical protein NDU88_000759 [Pleurodeles waltl]|uniref:Uncharacterized protein n=1 Tax=Pleurodeles waltl TaxID=8319 RepID=A0AAV7MQS6_PLEWA|nr:hypothetical protein NDU88_000759 [Pleurodeles waltl]
MLLARGAIQIEELAARLPAGTEQRGEPRPGPRGIVLGSGALSTRGVLLLSNSNSVTPVASIKPGGFIGGAEWRGVSLHMETEGCVCLGLQLRAS